MSEKRMIVGLGNPGQEYTLTRHNCGFMVVDRLLRDHHVDLKKISAEAFAGQWRDGDTTVWLVKPTTYMNLSGRAVMRLMKEKGIEPHQMLVVCDDFNLPFGQLRLKASGSHAGHNGLRSVHDHLGHGDYPRLRIGIGAPAFKGDVVDFVLGRFTEQEQKDLELYIERAARCSAVWAKEGAAQAMNQFNQKEDQ
jgi:PTH1 family peptidyl-tRNA hydrolase